MLRTFLRFFPDFWLRLRLVEVTLWVMNHTGIRGVNWSFQFFPPYQQLEITFTIDWEFLHHNHWEDWAYRDISPTKFMFKCYFGFQADIGFLPSKALLLRDMVVKHKLLFDMGFFIEIVRFSGIHEAYFLNHVCHRYNLCSQFRDQ